MTTKNEKIQYGEVEIDDLEFDPQRVKVLVTTMLDEDVLNGLKEIAAAQGQSYQTVLNQALRAFVEQKD